MISRLATGVLLATAVALGTGEGSAQPPPPAAPPPAAAPTAAPAPQAQPQGAVVVAVSDGVGPAARALAFDVYRDPDLRPTVDDATARVLAGDAPPEGASARLKELAELRASVVHAGSDLVARRLLASLGTELQASLVIAVSLDGTRPVARALRPATAAFERIELGPTVDIAADGARTYRWPGAVGTLHGLLPAGSVPATPAAPSAPAAPGVTTPATPSTPLATPLAPKAESAAAPPAPAEPRPFYKSPWFWGSVGGAAAVGLSVFLISRATSSTASNVHLTGTVGP